MLFNISIHHGERFLLVAGAGSADLADLCGACSLLAEVGTRRNHRLALLDLLAVDPDLNADDRAKLGAFCASLLRRFDKVAVVMPALHRTGVGEKVARDSGLTLEVFTDLAAASEWLEEA